MNNLIKTLNLFFLYLIHLYPYPSQNNGSQNYTF